MKTKEEIFEEIKEIKEEIEEKEQEIFSIAPNVLLGVCGG